MTDTITRDELLRAIDAGEVIVVETLGPTYYAQGHLPGAINIPHTEVEELAPTLLPDTGAAIVTYCSNAACRNSSVVQARLIGMGYANVRKYAEGKQDWQQAGLTLEDAGAAVAG